MLMSLSGSYTHNNSAYWSVFYGVAAHFHKTVYALFHLYVDAVGRSGHYRAAFELLT